MAGFFACYYIDLTEGIENFFSGRGSEEYRELSAKEIHDAYMSINQGNERKEIVKWLIAHSYDQAKRKLKGNSTLDAFRNIVVDV